MLNHLLSLLIWLPIIGGVVVLFTDRQGPLSAEVTRWVALIFAVLTFALSMVLYTHFNSDSWHMQFVENTPWIPFLNIRYSLGVDGISTLFIILTTFTNIIIILSAWQRIEDKVGQYMAIFLISTGLMNGAFCATDAILFYVFWEAGMIPMYLGIGVWGGQRRAYASIKFFLYTFLGSIFMLIAFLYLGHKAGSFNIAGFLNLSLNKNEQDLIFLAFLAAFAVKIPMWPFHTWLPDAHSEAPSGGSVVLAALMLKMGAYGFLRFSMPIVPGVHQTLDWLLIAMSLVAIVYVGFAAIVQKDIKRLIAYSSVSHMGLVTLGIFMVFMILGQANGHSSASHADAMIGVQGAMFQMIAHAFSSGAMFIGAGFLFQRYGSRLIKDYQGVAHALPVLATFMMLFMMANVGLPGTSGFVGEFMIVIAAFKANIWLALIAGLTLVIAPAYTLWMYKRVFFGELQNQALLDKPDMNKMEWLVFLLLAIPTIVFGIYPEPILSISHAAIAHFVQHDLTIIAQGAYA